MTRVLPITKRRRDQNAVQPRAHNASGLWQRDAVPVEWCRVVSDIWFYGQGCTRDEEGPKESKSFRERSFLGIAQSRLVKPESSHRKNKTNALSSSAYNDFKRKRVKASQAVIGARSSLDHPASSNQPPA